MFDSDDKSIASAAIHSIAITAAPWPQPHGTLFTNSG